MFGALAGAGLSNAISARAVRALVAGEERRLHGFDPAGNLDRLPGRNRRSRRAAGDRGYPRIILARRTLGVASAGYALLHLSLYVLDQHFDLFKVASEIVLRIYLLIGAVALAGLITLASTSTDAAISRLGSARWNVLHRLVYGIAVLGAVHFFIQSKLNIYQPVLMAGFLAWLLAYRSLFRRNGEVTPLQLLLLAVAAATFTAVGEALIYMFTSGVDARRVLLAHFDVDAEVRPAWWVLAAGLAVAALAFWRQKPARQRASRRPISSSAMSGATQVQSGS
jgi:methionine sulfoxide reductase heme-binding subunit